ncbi:MAG: hypothetical protein ACTHK7_14445 [Aureliella sp.]
MSSENTPPQTETAAPVDDAPTGGLTVRLSWLSAVLASLLALEIIGLCGYAFYVAKREMEPERLARRAEAALSENYDSIRSEVLQQVRHQAPVVAKQMSNRLLDETPNARRDLEEFTVRHLEQGFDNAFELSADEFRQWLRANHDAIEDAFEQIEQAPEDARLLVMDTEASLEEQLGLDLRDQAKLTLELYRVINEKLERLSQPSAELSEQERLERRVVRLLRALVQ